MDWNDEAATIVLARLEKLAAFYLRLQHGPGHLREDVAIEALTLLYTKGQEVTGEQGAWLTGVVRMLVRRRTSEELRYQPQSIAPELAPDSGEMFEASTAQTERAAEVLARVSRLSGPLRIVAELHLEEALSLAEIGRTIGEKPATVRKRWERARHILRASPHQSR